MEHRIGMLGKRMAQGGSGYKRIAVAVAAYPTTDVQKVGQLQIGIRVRQLFLHRAIHRRQRLEKTQRKNGNAVVDFVFHRKFVVAGFAGLPQREQHGFNLGKQFIALFLIVAGSPALQQRANTSVESQRSLALHFGWVGGQYRRDGGFV